jgi:hypothetical protein
MKEKKRHIFKEVRFHPAQFLAVSFIIAWNYLIVPAVQHYVRPYFIY